MRIRHGLALLVGSALALGAAYHAGRTEGAAGEIQDRRDDSLRVNAVAIAQLAPKLERDVAMVATRKAKSDTARREYAAARSHVELVDAETARIDGELLKLPPPVIATIARGDDVAVRDSLEKLSLAGLAADYKHKSELLEIRVGILEEQLADERSAKHRQRIRDLLTAGLLGGALGVIATHR